MAQTDPEIQRKIKDELQWEPRIHDSDIVAFVKNGHVILSGVVDSYKKKTDAEIAAIRIEGVTGVENTIQVRISDKKSDAEIEKAIKSSITWNSSVDESKIRIRVNNGWVTLEGEVAWEYQKSRAEEVVKDISSVTGISNFLEVISPFPVTRDIKEKIDAALKRAYALSSHEIKVDVRDKKVILTGKVRTLRERAAAETAAWSAPGIAKVDNKLEVRSSEVFSS